MQDEARTKAEELLDKLIANENVSHMAMFRERRQIYYLTREVEKYRAVADEADLLIDMAKESL